MSGAAGILLAALPPPGLRTLKGAKPRTEKSHSTNKKNIFLCFAIAVLLLTGLLALVLKEKTDKSVRDMV